MPAPAPPKMMTPVATSVIDVMATLMDAALLGRELCTEAVIADVSSASTSGSASALRDTAERVSAPGTAVEPCIADGDAAIGACTGMGLGEVPAAPQSVSTLREHGASIEGSEPLHVEHAGQVLDCVPKAENVLNAQLAMVVFATDVQAARTRWPAPTAVQTPRHAALTPLETSIGAAWKVLAPHVVHVMSELTEPATA